MPILHNSVIPAAADSTPADPVVRSLRFNGSVSSSEAGHLYRTAGTPTDEGKWTMSMWVKVGQQPTNGYMTLFGAGTSNDNAAYVAIYNGNLYADQATSSNHRTIKCSGALFRDPNAWYHLCFAYDNSQTGSSGNNQNAFKWYVNGVRLTEPTYSNNESVTGYTHRFNSSGYVQRIGKNAHRAYNSTYKYHWDGLIADVHFVDGQQLEPTDFIESNDYGGYKPKEYTGTYGNNGFHIDAQVAHDSDLLVTSIDRNDGDTQFADAAAGHGLTVSGDTEHSIAVGNPFTGDDRAVTLPATNGNLEIADHNDFDLGDTDWTVEGWFNLQNSGAQSLISKSGEWHIYYSSGEIRWYLNNSFQFRCYWTATLGKWHHIALCHDSSANDLQFYIDGEPISSNESSSTSSYSWPTGSGDLFVNKWSDTYATQYTKEVHVFDVRVVNGTKVYSGSFTPPSGKLTTTGGTYPSTTNVDTSITSSHTVLLIQPEKDDTGFHDESDSGHTITGYGSPTRTASSPYEAAAKSTAIHFDGSGDYLQTSTSSDLTFGTGDFTVETWFYPTTVNTSSAYKGIISDEVYSNTGGWALSQRDDELSLWIKNTGGSWVSFVADGALTANQWQHIAVSYDSSTTTTRLFVDGTSVASGTTSGWNLTGDQIEIGRSVSGQEITGYLFDVRATKGTAIYTSNFTAPSAAFELNPVYIGGDQSGNKNHFTPTNISGHDVMLDVPTKNYATLNPLDKGSSTTMLEGNCGISVNTNSWVHHARSTFSVSSGKWYWECTDNNGWGGSFWKTGIAPSAASAVIASNISGAYTYYAFNGSGASSGSSWSSGDIIGIALDLDNGTCDIYKNNSSMGTLVASGLSGEYSPYHDSYNSQTIYNFGQDPTFAGSKTSGQDSSQSEFYYAPPTGFKSLNSSNLTAPVTPSEHFDILTYTGNSDLYNGSGSTQNVTGVNFDVGMAWIKDRDNNSSGYTSSGSDEYGHYLFDTVTGTSSGGYNLDGDVVSSGSGTTLNSGYYGVTSFSAGSGTSRGITVDEAGETNFDYDDGYSALTERYVAWLWKLGSTGSSSTWNSSYTAPSTEHYNAEAGVTTIEVSPVSSGNLEVAHSLSAAPEFFFVGTDGYGDFSGYPAFHKDLDSGKYLQLDGTSAQSSNSNYFPSGAAHADYIKLGSVFADSYGYGNNLRIWAFTGVEGYSKFGTYSGVGSSGVFVYTGHRPKTVWIKNMGTTGNWFIFDAVRDTYNETVKYIWANSSTSEATNSGWKLDILSNGFKINVESTHMNNPDWDYVFCSFAESPFKHANAR